jgi:uncharacterized membrane protein
LLGAALKRAWPLGLAAAALLLSALLEWLHVSAYQTPGASSFCAVGAKLDCTTPALSRFSVLFGLPVALWGVVGGLALLLAAWIGSAWLVPLALGAALGSLALLGVEIGRVGALCVLCEVVHALSLALAVVAWRSRRALTPIGDREAAALVLLPPLGLLLGLLLFLPPYWRVVGFRGDLPFEQGVTTDGAHWLGAATPTLTLDEYTDYLCPHCRAASDWTLHRLAARPSEIRLVRRQYPLARCSTRAGSCERLRFAYCGDEQGRFWQMDRWLFAHGEDREVEPAKAASDLGLDAARLASCIERPDIYARAARESDVATTRRFAGAPTYVVNGKRVPPETADRFLEHGRPD